jgi:hypothetical protein
LTSGQVLKPIKHGSPGSPGDALNSGSAHADSVGMSATSNETANDQPGMVSAMRAGEHHYVSTACLHLLHNYCRGVCKFCGLACRCPHHTTPWTPPTD